MSSFATETGRWITSPVVIKSITDLRSWRILGGCGGYDCGCDCDGGGGCDGDGVAIWKMLMWDDGTM